MFSYKNDPRTIKQQIIVFKSLDILSKFVGIFLTAPVYIWKHYQIFFSVEEKNTSINVINRRDLLNQNTIKT